MGDDRNIRHRFTVPSADSIVNNWIEKQSNLGFSLRVLIKAFVQSYGYQDATCIELGMPVRKRGRPPKQAKIRYDRMEERIDEITDDETTYDDERESFEHDIKQEFEPKIEPEQNEPEPDIEDMFNASFSTPVRPSENTDMAETDDDGFIDPESLLI